MGNKFDIFEKEEESIKEEKRALIENALKKLGKERYELINTSAKTGMNINYLFEKIAADCFTKFGSTN